MGIRCLLNNGMPQLPLLLGPALVFTLIFTIDQALAGKTPLGATPQIGLKQTPAFQTSFLSNGVFHGSFRDHCRLVS